MMPLTAEAPPDDVNASAADSLVAWAEAEARPRAMVGAHRQLLWCNAAFRAQMDQAGDLWESSGCLQLTHPKLTEAFDIALRKAGKVASDWTCRRPDGNALVFTMLRLSAPSSPLVVGLTVQVTGEAFRPRWADYRSIFGLTPSEHRTVQALLEGRSVGDAAQALGLAVPTLRSHVRNAYAKLGVGSREELFRALLAYRID